MKSEFPESGCRGVRTRRVLLYLMITVVVLSVVANFVLRRQSQNVLADGNALQLPLAPTRHTQLVEELVPLSPNEEFVRVGGYRTVRVDITNRVKGYSRSANLSQGQHASWSYSGRFLPSDLNVRGALVGDDVLAIMKAVDTNSYGRIHTILSAEKGIAHVTAGNFGMLSGHSFDLLVAQSEGGWRFIAVQSEAWH